MEIDSYKDLIVWQKAMKIAENVYALVKCFPKDERYCLSEQMRRAAISIPSNIAEGRGRCTKKEFSQFVFFARGSLCELETQLMLAVRLRMISEENSKPTMELCNEVGKMLTVLLKKLQPNA